MGLPVLFGKREQGRFRGSTKGALWGSRRDPEMAPIAIDWGLPFLFPTNLSTSKSKPAAYYEKFGHR